MKLALDPAMLNGSPIEEEVRAAGRAGYRFLELGNRDDIIAAYGPVRAEQATLAAMVAVAAEVGVEFVSVAVIQDWSDPDEDVRRQAVAWWRDGIEAAARLGCTRLNTELSGDPLRPDACRRAFLRSIEELLPDLERAGMEVAAEPHPGDFIETTAEALELVAEVGDPRFRYLHCLPHTFYLGGTAAEQLALAHDAFDHVHVADTFRPDRTILNPPTPERRIHQHFDIGAGELEWRPIAQGLEAAGFDGILTVQVYFWEERAESSFRANRDAADRLFTRVLRGGDIRDGHH
jgi:myo-inositol catabolism protein IolH